MNRFLVLALLGISTAVGAEIPRSSDSDVQARLVTFNKDVLPIVQKNCQSCHRPGGIGPMSLMTYENARPWAKAIKTAVVSKQMPPWFADPQHGAFRNAPQLTPGDIQTLALWADSGAREGDAADKPAPIQWVEGWRIQPDVVVSMPQPYKVVAKGNDEVREFFVESPFKEDTWVTSIEIRPGDTSVVHHVIVQVPEQNQMNGFVFKKQAVDCAGCPAVTVQKAVLDAVVFQAQQAFLETARHPDMAFTVSLNRPGGVSAYSDMLVRLNERRTGQGAFTTMEAVYAPGSTPIDFRFTDSAKLVRGGLPIRIEVHYTPNGKETTDQTSVGFTLAKSPAQRRFIIMAPEHMADTRKPIPAGQTNWETRGELTFNQDAELVWFMPHMHLRGKDMTFQLVHPDGRQETALSAKFDFHWQLGYEVEKPIKVTKGTRMIVTAHHDNSASNPANPEPGKDAQWGEMTAQEMMLPWFGVVVDRDVPPNAIATYVPPDLDGPLQVALPKGAKEGAVRVEFNPAFLRQ